LEFIEENIKNREHKYFEFDRIGIINNSNIFYHKIVNEKGKRKIILFYIQLDKKEIK
jgi:hypothetical protein